MNVSDRVVGTDLSPRQREVMGQLCLGLRDREIANRLGVSIETVRTHVAFIRKKLGVGTRTGAVARWLWRGSR